MKTTATILIAITLIVLGGYFINLTTEALTYAPNVYMDTKSDEVYNFRFILTISSLFTIILSILSFVFSAMFINIAIGNIKNNIKRHRDKALKNHLEQLRYQDVYNKLNNTNIYEEKERIVKEFYDRPVHKKFKGLFDAILEESRNDKKN